MHPRMEHQVFPGGQVPVEVVFLGNDADQAAHLLGGRQHAVSFNKGITACGTHQRRQDPDQGRLARAIGSKQAKNDSLFNLKGKVIHCLE